jgi:hypothetical protein
MNITRSQAVALGILVAQAVVAFLLTQPDVTLAPIVKVGLGALSVGLSTIALFLKLQPAGPVITVPQGGKPVSEG